MERSEECIGHLYPLQAKHSPESKGLRLDDARLGADTFGLFGEMPSLRTLPHSDLRCGSADLPRAAGRAGMQMMPQMGMMFTNEGGPSQGAGGGNVRAERLG